MDLLGYLTDDLSRTILAELIAVLILLLILLNVLKSKRVKKEKKNPFEKEEIPEIERKSEEDDLIAELKKVHSAKTSKKSPVKKSRKVVKKVVKESPPEE